MSEIKIQGADQLVKNISQRVGRSKVDNVVKKNTANLQTEMQRRAAVDTGFLKRSMTIDFMPGRMTGSVDVGAEYGAYVNYGTRFMAAQPFAAPSLQKVQPMFINDLRNLIK